MDYYTKLILLIDNSENSEIHKICLHCERQDLQISIMKRDNIMHNIFKFMILGVVGGFYTR